MYGNVQAEPHKPLEVLEGLDFSEHSERMEP